MPKEKTTTETTETTETVKITSNDVSAIRERNKITPIARTVVMEYLVAGKTVYAFRTRGGVTVNCNDKTVSVVRTYMCSDEYLFFIIESV